MNRLRLALELRSYLRDGFTRITRAVVQSYACLIRLTRGQPETALPPELEHHAAEFVNIYREAQARAERRIIRTAEQLEGQYGAASQGLVKGIRGVSEIELLVWRYENENQLSSVSALSYIHEFIKRRRTSRAIFAHRK